MAVKWKCNHCSKLLSSKQTVLYHLKVVHSDADLPSSFSKVILDSENEDIRKKSKINTVSKGKAFRYFSALDNLFNDDSILESFQMGQSSRQRSNGSVDTSLSVENQHVSANDSPVKQPQLDVSIDSSQNDSVHLTPPDYVSDITFSCETLPDIDTLLQPIQSTSTFSDGRDKSAAGQLVSNSSTTNNISQVSAVSEPGRSKVVKAFKPPFKTRGHCDDPDCEGCKTEPCGICDNCLHKKERRLADLLHLRVCPLKGLWPIHSSSYKWN